jgi:hypothetical protein
MRDKRETRDSAFGEWRRILKPRANNQGELLHLDGHWTKLESVLTQIDAIDAEQARLTAAKQEKTGQLNVLIAEGRKIATFLKAGLREHYGRRAEKLAEYGMQPFRGFKKKPEEPVEVQKPASASTTD